VYARFLNVLLSGRFGMRSIQDRSPKEFEKHASKDLDVSDYGESKSAIKDSLRPLSGRNNFL
jgi:hypothetical protein